MSSLKKKCQVVMLSTEKANKWNIGLHNNKLCGVEIGHKFENEMIRQHLYIVNDEEIKEGDYCIDGDRVFRSYEIGDIAVDNFKKIIATTDSSLHTGFAKTLCFKCNSKMKVNLPDNIECISCGQKGWNLIQGVYNEISKLPQPSPQFIVKYIEEYNKGNIITEVMVEYEEIKSYSGNNGLSIKEFVKTDSNNYITITKVKDSWSREDIIHALTYGVSEAKKGLSYAVILQNYKKEQNL